VKAHPYLRHGVDWETVKSAPALYTPEPMPRAVPSPPLPPPPGRALASGALGSGYAVRPVWTHTLPSGANPIFVGFYQHKLPDQTDGVRQFRIPRPLPPTIPEDCVSNFEARRALFPHRQVTSRPPAGSSGIPPSESIQDAAARGAGRDGGGEGGVASIIVAPVSDKLQLRMLWRAHITHGEHFMVPPYAVTSVSQ